MITSTNSSSDVIGTPSQRGLGVRDQDVRKIVHELIQRYKSYVTPIREVTINALETTDNAVQDGRDFRPVEIDISADQYTVSPFAKGSDNIDGKDMIITITDHGEGMSPEFMENFFTSLGASTKDEDAHAIGGFGIGSKSILSLTDYATWRTVKDGFATVMVISADAEQGYSVNYDTVEAPDEDNGTVVTIPVTNAIGQYVVRNIEEEFLNFVSSDRVIVTGNIGSDITVGSLVDNIVHTASNGTQFIAYNGENAKKVRVMVNGAPYPAPSGVEMYRMAVHSKIDVDRSINVSFNEVIVNLDQNHPDVTILGSRESLVESDALRDLIKNQVQDAVTEMVNDYMADIAEANTADALIRSVNRVLDDNAINFSNGSVYRYGLSRISNAIGNAIGTLCGSRYEGRSIFDDGTIADAKNGQLSSIADVMDSHESLLVGKADIKNPGESYGSLPTWKRVLNTSLALTTTERMSDALRRADTITDLTKNKNVPRFYVSELDINDTVSTIMKSAYGMVGNGNIMTIQNIITEIESRIVFSDITADEVREMVKKNLRSVAKAPRRSKEEIIDDSPIHVLSYQETDQGKGFQLVKYFPSAPQAARWVTKHEKKIIFAYSESEVPWYHKNGSAYVTDDDITGMDAKEAKQLAESVPGKDLHVVVIRKDSLRERLVDMTRNNTMSHITVTKHFIEESERRIMLNSMFGDDFADEDIDGLVDALMVFMKNFDNDSPLLVRLTENFEVTKKYRPVVDMVINDGKSNPGGEHMGESVFVRQNLSNITKVFDEKIYLDRASYTQSYIFSDLDGVQGNSYPTAKVDIAKVMRRYVDMLTDMSGGDF